MPRLSAEKINEIRQSVDIVDVIGNYLSLQKKGRNYVSLCPFHDDSHPSMSISPERQIYMCFVCHNGGNVFTFLKNYHAVTLFTLFFSFLPSHPNFLALFLKLMASCSYICNI